MVPVYLCPGWPDTPSVPGPCGACRFFFPACTTRTRTFTESGRLITHTHTHTHTHTANTSSLKACPRCRRGRTTIKFEFGCGRVVHLCRPCAHRFVLILSEKINILEHMHGPLRACATRCVLVQPRGRVCRAACSVPSFVSAHGD